MASACIDRIVESLVAGKCDIDDFLRAVQARIEAEEADSSKGVRNYRQAEDLYRTRPRA
jgi:hypothetical protein